MTMSLVQTVTVGSGGAADITFSNIPQDATDLLVVCAVRSPENNVERTLGIQINGNTSDIYSTLRLQGDGSTSSTNKLPTGSGVPLFALYGATQGAQTTSNTFSNCSIYFPNYASTTINKSMSAETVIENNATTAFQTIFAGNAGTTAAITSIKLFDSGSSFVQNSTASLYKIKKA